MTYYSNVGAASAAYIVERISDLSFEQYVRDNILNQLGIGKKEAGYRLADFADRKDDLIEHYVYNASWLGHFQQMIPQLNVIQVKFAQI